MYYVYLIQNVADNDDFYLGCSANLKQRFQSHNQGKNYATKGKQWKIVHYEAYVNLSAARKREYCLKHDGRARRFLMQRVKESIE